MSRVTLIIGLINLTLTGQSQLLKIPPQPPQPHLQPQMPILKLFLSQTSRSLEMVTRFHRLSKPTSLNQKRTVLVREGPILEVPNLLLNPQHFFNLNLPQLTQTRLQQLLLP